MERLFPPEGYSEHAEMYLKAILRLKETGETPARVASISSLLKVKPPSVVGMLTKLNANGFVRPFGKRGVVLTSAGRKEALRLLRNCRLVEVFMRDALAIRVDDRVACRLEHRLTEEFADSLCRMLHHPRICPHGIPIPIGKCCRAETVP
jgi:DtxR family transcriptional regulator, Mn-dependent transcriptional regulator